VIAAQLLPDVDFALHNEGMNHPMEELHKTF
jgi:hypothetical protein